MAAIAFEGVTKRYPDGTEAVRGLDLTVADGELMILVGPSGCGKSTALRMIAGLEQISDGAIRIGDTVVNRLQPKERDLAMVFQNYALYPHMTVAQNMGFALKMARRPKAEIAEKVRAAADVLDLADHLERKPAQLSGGQRQRVAMGRAIVREPKAFLMDEPLSNLDAKLRVQMRAEIARLQGDLGVTTIYVTHDQIEAMTMGDRVAVMRKGELQQVAAPQELYDRPVNLFVGGFIGSPAMNLVEARLESSNGGGSGGALDVVLGDQRLALPQELLAVRPALRGWAGRELVLGIRPESLSDAAIDTDAPADRRLKAHVTLRESLGSEVDVHATIGARSAETEHVRELIEDRGGLETLEEGSGETTIVGRLAPRTRAAEGETVELAVDAAALHFFDPGSGLGIYDATQEGAGT